MILNEGKGRKIKSLRDILILLNDDGEKVEEYFFIVYVFVVLLMKSV